MTMTAEPKVQEDGNLPAGLRALADAIDGLCEPRQEHHDGKLYWSDSWYQQLVEACPGDQGQHHNPHAGSVVPFWVDAVELRNEIDLAVWAWQRDPGPFDGDLTPNHPPTPETLRRLRLIQRRPWRPMDVARIYQIVDALKAWAAQIDEKLNPIPMRTLWDADDSAKYAACPQCGERFVYKRDSGGESVRQPALQMDPSGFTKCSNRQCQTEWHAPFILCAMLGYDLPAGMEKLRESLGIPDPD